MKIPFCLVQPPFVQLNSPYPGIFYLRSFLEKRGNKVLTQDHSIALFESIFCRNGLAKIFTDAKAKDNNSEKVLYFLSNEKELLSAIDSVVDFLRGRNHERGHLIALANGVLPGGPYFDTCLANIRNTKGDAGPDDASLLATSLLADIAGFITQTLDGGFSLIRYMPSPLRSQSEGFKNFSSVRNGLNGYIMNHFYRPFLDGEWSRLADKMPNKFILGITVPFPGCLAGAMVCAESAKAFFGDRVIVAVGGGYVNTELRFLEEEALFDYFDYLCFDRGYGSLDAVLDRIEAEKTIGETPLYKTMYRNKNGVIVKDKNINNICAIETENRGIRIDNDSSRTVFPDYSGIDFSRYIRPVDNANPMHRLWSDGRWLKAYLAHGCYWRNCVFCDTGLDYIRSYNPANVNDLFQHLCLQAEATGIRGVHLVDEACPPASLLRLALLNRNAGLPLVFWGNVRLDKNFTPDAAAVLAAGGLVAVSSGIEVATEKGLARLGKGFDLQGAVNACAAFKEAGILVHAYLIYGYWDEDEQETADSAEIVRQFFEQGLLDSAFWHQFTLTRHSRLYAEKQQGKHHGLRPKGDCGGQERDGRKKIFAFNDLAFAGEKKFDRFSGPLNTLLGKWMNGETLSVSPELSSPSVSPDLVINLLDNYARRRDKERAVLPDPKRPLRVIFLASRPFVYPGRTAKTAELKWHWRFENCSLRLKPGLAEQLVFLLEEAADGSGMNAAEFFCKLEAIFGGEAKQVWKKLRRQGLLAASCDF